MTRLRLVALALGVVVAASASEPPADLMHFIPQSISPQARAIFERLLPVALKHRAEWVAPKNVADYDARRAKQMEGAEARGAAVLQKLGVSARDRTLGGVPVVELTPPQVVDEKSALLYVHGGAFVLGSAHSTLGLAALMAAASGRRVVSVDYTVAPHAQWPQITDQVLAVHRALLADDVAPEQLGWFGDSAGGNLVAASALKLRDASGPMPAALILLSPCTDLGQHGDTNVTLAPADPALDPAEFPSDFEAYAPRADWKNPYVSPVYGDFSRGYPPVLLQAGTKELLLSDSVRLYQAVQTAGGSAELDVYEGMPHVFQSYMMDTPEQRAAFAAARRFWDAHLRKP